VTLTLDPPDPAGDGAARGRDYRGRADRRFHPRANLLRRLKALGIRIAMDDFGTGYSSLSYLQPFPFDKIKIDRSFISNLEATPQSAEIVRAVLSLAHGLNIPVVAEGVETEAQRAFLAREACEEMQGYLVGRPDLMERYLDLVGVTLCLGPRPCGIKIPSPSPC
jgi:EAL domain-containing protein (putative c-di-GMP-specific phosphodiesterase class I)